MANVAVTWRPSGSPATTKKSSKGRGEFEYVPADALKDRVINVLFEPLRVTIPAEVRGVHNLSQGKPRVRKFEPNNRKKLHLPQLVFAVARLPEPRREDFHGDVVFPLENKAFVMDSMNFEVMQDDGVTVTLMPTNVSVKHTNVVINLRDRLVNIDRDIADATNTMAAHSALSVAIKVHGDLVSAGVNTSQLRWAADEVIRLQTSLYGSTNAASATVLDEVARLPETELEADIRGIEGRFLTRIHSYRERDRKLTARAKKFYRGKNDGVLKCEVCNLNAVSRYGPDGERCIEAHHTTPIEELQPDSVTTVTDLVMVCASCHRIIHSKRPCLTVLQIRNILGPHSPP